MKTCSSTSLQQYKEGDGQDDSRQGSQARGAGVSGRRRGTRIGPREHLAAISAPR